MSKDLTKHKIQLAEELLDDVELSRLKPEQVLLKVSRLARLVDADEISKWIRFELNGFPSDDCVALKYMDKTGRWTNKNNMLGYWKSLAEINGHITATELQIQRLRVPDINFSPSSSNPTEIVTGAFGSHIDQVTNSVSTVLNQLQSLANTITKLNGIRSRVLSALHDFVASTYYELVFSGLAESIFEKHKSMIDAPLRDTAGDALDKIPAIYDRLTAGDREAVSQALNTCRRLIRSLADSVYPPQDGTITIDGEEFQLGANAYLNRIKAYLHEHCPSDSRRKRLHKTIRSVNERASAGVHADVTLDEAKSLFLQTYLTLGEILLVKTDTAHDT